MVAYFQLQPAETDLQQLADQYWAQAGERERKLEAEAYAAGESIRKGEFSLANIEAIVRWKSERAVHYLIGNSDESIKSVLTTIVAPETSTEAAIRALVTLRGIDLSIASAILSAIFPERYAVLDYRALEALGYARHNVDFYIAYNNFIKRLVDCEVTQPQEDLPGPTSLHTVERALWQWSRNQGE